MFKPRCIVDKETGKVMRAEQFIDREAHEWGSAFGTLAWELAQTPFDLLSDLTSDFDPYKIKKQKDLSHFMDAYMKEMQADEKKR